jgi:hypothetical protein
VSTNQVPNGTITQGQIWTPAQWNAAWQSKVDASGGFSTNETITDPAITGGTQSAPAITNPTITDPAITGGTMSAPAISNPTVTGNLPVTGNVTAANITSGTFTATLTGMTTTVTATAKYTIAGNIVVIGIPTTTGTSNAATFSITGLPSSLQPSSLTQTAYFDSENAGAGALAQAVVTPGSATISFGIGAISGSFLEFTASGWTPSGTKGLIDFSITYQLQ